MTQIDPYTKDPQTYALIGAAIEVRSRLGCGYLAPVYQEAMQIERALRGIPFQREVVLEVRYKGSALSCGYKADFICFGDIIVEIKALARLGKVEQAQVINYLKATGYTRRLLLNFGAPSLEFHRYVA